MNNPILITYATRAGSTAEVAAAIAQELTARGYRVEIKPIKQKPSPEGYQAVIIGSATRFGQWLPEAVEFVKANQAALRRLPVALFTTHILNLGEDKASQANRQAYLSAVLPLLKPVSQAFFAGNGDLSKVSFIEGLIGRMVKSPTADLRDWGKIHAWAQGVFA